MNTKNMKKYLPGMRNIKTSIAILIDLLIFSRLNMENAFYACIASVVCMQQSVKGTVAAGKNRLVGTSIAALIGLIMYYIGEKSHNPSIYFFLIPVGVTITIQICVLMKCQSSVSIACIVYISILTSHRLAGDSITYPLTRIIETFVGISVSTLVNKYFSHTYLTKFKNLLTNFKKKS